MAKGQQKTTIYMHLDMFLIILRNTWSAHTCEKVGQLEKGYTEQKIVRIY